MAASQESRWQTAARNPHLQLAIADDDTAMALVAFPIDAIADDSGIDDDVRYVAGLLATVAWFMANGADWVNPYGPYGTFSNRRSPIPADFSEADIEVLDSVANLIPNLILRSRVFDIVAICGEPKLRPSRHVAQLQALTEHGVTSEAMVHCSDQWNRGLEVGIRFQKIASEQLDEIERQLCEVATSSSDGDFSTRAARMLAKYRLGRERAADIAGHLVRHSEGGASIAALNTLQIAAEWYRFADDSKAAEDVTYEIVQRLISEADQNEAFRASIHLEKALKTLRTLPRSARERLGATELSSELARRIRETGAASLGQMETHTSESYDLSREITDLLNAIRSDDPIESLNRLAGFQPFAKLADARTEAEKHLREFPVSALFGRRTLSADGRTIYRSPADEHSTIYGEKASIWEGMIQDYQIRVNILGSAVLPKAWHQISTDHLLQVHDFQILATNSSIVPSLCEGVFARGLYYGYTGDFGAAVHLLAPGMEALVRYHLANVGECTSTISPEGNETEVGLSALMENERVAELLGEDIVFELRALLCGPTGPNLRNNVAHGLIGDAVFYSGASVYLWWFTLKIVLMPFWNALHNPEAAEARETAVPKEYSEPE